MAQHGNTRSAEARGATSGAKGTFPDHVLHAINILVDNLYDRDGFARSLYEDYDNAVNLLIHVIAQDLKNAGDNYAWHDPIAAALDFIEARSKVWTDNNQH